MKYAIGTDIGGSHISCAAIDMENGIILRDNFSSVEVDNKAPADIILNKWVEALSGPLSQINKKELAGIGFAMPGPFDYETGIAMFTHEVAKYENLYKVDIAGELGKLLFLNGNSQFRFMNDATSFAVGEAWVGKAKGFRRSVSITLGTGFGSAFIDSGIPVVNRDDVPKLGCLWHLPFKEGIADDYFSTRWYIKEYMAKTGKTLPGVKEIADETRHNEQSFSVFNEFGYNLGHFLGEWLKKFRAECLVIGGNVAGAYGLFGDAFEHSLLNQDIKISIGLSELKEDAALVGSVKLFDPGFWQHVKPLLKYM